MIMVHEPPESIRSWKGLCREFLVNFQGTSKRLGMQVNLYKVIQRKNEPLRKFVQRFSNICNIIPNMDPVWVISAFAHGVRDKDVVGELGVRGPQTVVELF